METQLGPQSTIVRPSGPDMDLYADPPGMRAAENPVATIPEPILSTTPWQDVVIIEQKDVTHIELTIPHNSLKQMSGLWNVKQKKNNTNKY